MSLSEPISPGTKRRYNKTGYHIDMTPYVDVIMLLLTFFIMTTVLDKPQVMQINLPKSDEHINIPMNNIVFIRVSEKGNICISRGKEDGNEEQAEKVSLDEMKEKIEQYGLSNKNMILILKFHSKARYNIMVSVLDEINNAQIEKRYSFGKIEANDLRILESIGI